MATQRPLTAGDPDALAVRLAAHPFCAELAPDQVLAMAEGATLVEHEVDTVLFRHGGPADALFLLLDGDVALGFPGSDDPLETLHPGDALGWSWLFPPHTWVFDARCVTPVAAIRIEGPHLVDLVTHDASFGRALALRIGQITNGSLHLTRARLVAALRHDEG